MVYLPFIKWWCPVNFPLNRLMDGFPGDPIKISVVLPWDDPKTPPKTARRRRHGGRG